SSTRVGTGRRARRGAALSPETTLPKKPIAGKKARSLLGFEGRGLSTPVPLRRPRADLPRRDHGGLLGARPPAGPEGRHQDPRLRFHARRAAPSVAASRGDGRGSPLARAGGRQ